jgi:hypothetical protein
MPVSSMEHHIFFVEYVFSMVYLIEYVCQNHCSCSSMGMFNDWSLVVNKICVLYCLLVSMKGGGPYGAQVTRGQDLTGKDFSGQTLIKQDFKTVRSSDNFVHCIGALLPVIALCQHSTHIQTV